MKSLLSERVTKGYPDEPLLAATQSHGVIRKSDYGNRTVTATKDLHLLKLVEMGDFVISLRSFQGGIERCHHRGIISPAYTVLTAKSGLYRDYLTYLFKSKPFVSSLTLAVTGIREGQNIDYSKLSVERLPVPQAGEQVAIVKYLAHANARIDKAISVKRRLVALLEEQRTALTSQVMDVDDAPLIRMKDVCVRIVDCKNRTPMFVENGDFHVVRTTCVRSGDFSMEGSYPTDQENFSEWTQRGAPRHGDVFFTREAPAGEAALVPDRKDLCLGQRMMYFRPDPSMVLSEYLLLAIYAEPARRFINVATNGSTVGHLRVGDVGALPLRLPSIDEQRRIVAAHSEHNATIRRTKHRVEREIQLLGEFRMRLVADVVTGKVDVREIAASLPEVDLAASGGDVDVIDDADLTDFDDVIEAREG
ncbi:restriction endonuclease subunit S [Rhodococcus ruber]|uniref:restriction endonuclease subunit S n=1 Tax=Rhodococcus ruber TaxID=1830 RepID=UPI00191021DF|nr:restriction endonuclease subunit S [Rhodococcus ruber]